MEFVATTEFEPSTAGFKPGEVTTVFDPACTAAGFEPVATETALLLINIGFGKADDETTLAAFITFWLFTDELVWTCRNTSGLGLGLEWLQSDELVE